MQLAFIEGRLRLDRVGPRVRELPGLLAFGKASGPLPVVQRCHLPYTSNVREQIINRLPQGKRIRGVRLGTAVRAR